MNRRSPCTVPLMMQALLASTDPLRIHHTIRQFMHAGARWKIQIPYPGGRKIQINLSEKEYVIQLVTGVGSHRDRIDELIIAYAEGWDLDRMPAVDRNILRLAIYELLFEKNLPSDVAISEALKLSDENSTEESSKYINGVLARILALKPSLGIN